MANLKQLYQRQSTASASSGNSGDLPCGAQTTCRIDINVTAVTGAITFVLSRKGSNDSVYYPIWTSSAVSAPGVVSKSIGPGCTLGEELGDTVQLSWTVATGPATFSATVEGK